MVSIWCPRCVKHVPENTIGLRSPGAFPRRWVHNIRLRPWRQVCNSGDGQHFTVIDMKVWAIRTQPYAKWVN